MLLVAPWIINAAPYESTMGLVQKVFYFHFPSAILFLVAVDHLRRAQLPVPVPEEAERGRVGARRRRSCGLLFGALTLVTGPLWARKAWGVWWVWDPRLTSSLLLFLIFAGYLMLRKYGGPGSDRLGAGMALFGMAQRAVHLRVGQRLAHAASDDLGRADAADRHGDPALVLFCRVHACCSCRC